MRTNITRPLGVAMALVLLAACSHSEGGSTTTAPVAGLPSSDEVARVPMGSLAGGPDRTALAQSIHNPYEDNPEAVAEGSRLFIQLNCAGCHAYTSKGNMGPDLTDTYWRYGGLPVEIYQSIADGRAKGMPAWSAALPPPEIWKLVAYIQSLGGTVPAGSSTVQGAESGQVAPEVLAHAGSAADAPGIAPPRTPVPIGAARSAKQRTPLPVSSSSQ